MAEKEGFEPSMGVKAHTPLAGERLRPLGHLSKTMLGITFNLLVFQNYFTDEENPAIVAVITKV